MNVQRQVLPPVALAGVAAGPGARARLLTGLPVAERRLQLAGAPTAVLEGGAGPPVVLLHSSGEFAALWLRVIPELVAAHRVIAPDLPGHGASDLGDATLDAGRAVAWLGELIEHTCPAPPTIVGHGLGGAHAARFAIGRGDRLSRLVLVDAFGLAGFAPAPTFMRAVHEFVTQPTERTRDDLFRQCFVDFERVRAQLGARWESLATYALEGVRAPGMKAALDGLMPALGLPAIPPDDLARIASPVSLIWGRHDRQVRLEVAAAVSARHGWQLHIIENAGDDPAMEQPEAFLAALRAVLAAPTGTGARA
jgi:pimeloyl-ACP methyl ester carboxylesterase